MAKSKGMYYLKEILKLLEFSAGNGRARLGLVIAIRPRADIYESNMSSVKMILYSNRRTSVILTEQR